jgi:peptidoglycan/xylan/chitin deacetylase (PgdA/CDA1 family)
VTKSLIPIIVLAGWFGFGCGPGPEASPAAAVRPDSDATAIPAKTVVLTFDDAQRTHLEFVAPLLRELGFGATFFITAAWMKDRGNYLAFEEVAELARLGFEIGNHTYDHTDQSLPTSAATIPDQLGRIEEALAAVGVPKPTTFAWPANCFGPEASRVLRASGYRFGRRGPEPESTSEGLPPALPYDPRRHHRLLIPSVMACRDWTVEHFRNVVAKAEAGRAVVLQFHGIPEPAVARLSIEPELFRKFMSVLADGGFNVIAMRDLARYGVDRVPCRDPMTEVRCP